MLIDSAVIHVRSGKGGAGCVSFRREKFVPKGGPDGGDGGNGGSIIMTADPQVATLLDFAGRHHWHADNGEPGRATQQHGANADDLLLRVPPGTLVYNNDTEELIADLDRIGASIVAAKGGRGGWGNEHFKTATNQTPTQMTPGEPAIELDVRLELKLIADVGLVGMPNAGKSTLLSRISKARPKIADYPFTTLSPQLGIADLGGIKERYMATKVATPTSSSGGRRLVVADIPGLIEKAHEGVGLGMRFLRHIERTRVLVHMVEIEPMDGSDPVNNYHVIRRELAAYPGASGLADKPEIVVLSKMDLVSGDTQQAATIIRKMEQALGKPVLAVSAATGLGIRRLLEACWSLLKD